MRMTLSFSITFSIWDEFEKPIEKTCQFGDIFSITFSILKEIEKPIENG